MDLSLPTAIICDLDGTLALLGKRSPYDASQALEDTLNNPVASILRVYSQYTTEEVTVILLTGREEKFRPQTEAWLKKHDITYAQLLMRATGDFRKDSIIKKEIFHEKIAPHYNVLFVLDDRDQVVKMWRQELGLTCLQVEYGDF